jgi:hypothetical protein
LCKAGAGLKSQLRCSEGTKLINPGGRAFNADSISARSLFLSNTHVEGEVRLPSAELSVQFGCGEGTELINPEGTALNADACRVGGTFFFRLGEAAVGEVSLAYAQIGTLADNLASWPDAYNLVGFSYHSLGSDENLDRRLSEPFKTHHVK